MAAEASSAKNPMKAFFGVVMVCASWAVALVILGLIAHIAWICLSFGWFLLSML